MKKWRTAAVLLKARLWGSYFKKDAENGVRNVLNHFGNSALPRSSFLKIGLLLMACLLRPAVYGYSVDSMRTIAYSPNHSERLSAMLDLAWSIRQAQPDSALALLNEAERIAETQLDTSAQITAQIRRGVVLRDRGDLREAQGLFDQAEKLALLQRDSLALGRVHINTGQNLQQKGDYDASVEAVLKAIVIFEAYRNYPYVKVGYATLASTYIRLGKYEKSIEYYRKLLRMAQSQQDSVGMGTAWQNLGAAYFYSNQMDTALHFYNKSLKFAVAYGKQKDEAQINNGIGSVFFEQGNREEALEYFQKAQRLSKELGFVSEEVNVLNNLGAIFELKEEWSQAILHYRRAAKLAQYLGNRAILYGVFLNLSQTFEAKGQTDSALIYYQRHSSIKDSLINVQSNEQVAEMQEKYESAKKDQEIAQLNQIEEAQRADIRQRNFWLAGAAISTLLLLLALINYLSKLRVQKALVKRTAELNQQRTMQLINEHSEKSMKAYLQGETTERQRLGEQLHDQLGSQLATVKLYYDGIVGEVADKAQALKLQKANAMLSQACTDVRHIAHNLAADTLTEFGLEAAIADLCTTITDSGQLEVRLLCIGIDTRLPATLELVVFRSIQELLTNAIKHAEASQVQVRLKGGEDFLTVRIKDNGKGFDAQLMDGADGLGLQTISDRINTLKGQFNILSQPQEGTQIDFQVPMGRPRKAQEE